ncbi:MAG TPA: ThiF family adenylyltransferase [Burkholderiales bacterium]|nr:ThiF family adenylyltransferase [Burkholderiales bacterium]
MIVEFLTPAYDRLLDLCSDARSRGTETHAYLVGTTSRAEAIITDVVRAGTPVEQPAMTQPDYGASALALQPYLDRGLKVLGEAHLHLGHAGPSGGDRRTLLGIPPDKFPRYLCVVVALFADRKPIVTAHSVADEAIVEHTVRIVASAYPALLPASVQHERILALGAGSGNALTLLQVAKFGVERITIGDHDVFEPRNLPRHIVDGRALGKPKERSLASFLRRRSTSQVRALHLQITKETTTALDAAVRKHTLVINGTGHPVASVRISRSCARYSRPCVHAAAFARGAGGFVYLQTPGGPCYEDLYDLDLPLTSDDQATMAALTTQYGYTEDELHAQVGLWADVNTTASIHAKVILEYLKHGDQPHRPNLYLIDNEHLTIRQTRIARRPDCTSCKETP